MYFTTLLVSTIYLSVPHSTNFTHKLKRFCFTVDSIHNSPIIFIICRFCHFLMLIFFILLSRSLGPIVQCTMYIVRTQHLAFGARTLFFPAPCILIAKIIISFYQSVLNIQYVSTWPKLILGCQKIFLASEGFGMFYPSCPVRWYESSGICISLVGRV